MGMASYVYLSDKNSFEKEMLHNKEQEKKIAFYYSFVDKMIEKYPSLKGHFHEMENIQKTLSKEEMDEFERLFRFCIDEDELPCCENRVEMNYWQNPYPLHKYIIKHFLKDGTDDNCVNIPLDKDGVVKMIDSMKKCSMRFPNCKKGSDDFYNDEYYDQANLQSDIVFFNGLLDKFNDDVVIYYYSWY